MRLARAFAAAACLPVGLAADFVVLVFALGLAAVFFVVAFFLAVFFFVGFRVAAFRVTAFFFAVFFLVFLAGVFFAAVFLLTVFVLRPFPAAFLAVFFRDDAARFVLAFFVAVRFLPAERELFAGGRLREVAFLRAIQTPHAFAKTGGIIHRLQRD